MHRDVLSSIHVASGLALKDRCSPVNRLIAHTTVYCLLQESVIYIILKNLIPLLSKLIASHKICSLPFLKKKTSVLLWPLPMYH